MFSREIRRLGLVVLLAASAGHAAQFIGSDHAGDVFYGIGVTSNGVVRMAGERDGAAGFFDWNGGGFSFTPLAALLSGGYASAYRISADGSTIVGYSESPNTSVGYEATLWNAVSPNSTVGLGFLGGSLHDSFASGVTTVGGSTIVVGESTSDVGNNGFRWNSLTGLEALPRSGLPALTTGATGVSADGSIWVGTEDPSGLNSFRAVIGNSSGIQVLDALGNPFSGAGNISRDGVVAVGNIGQQAAFWSGSLYTPTLVTLDGAPLLGTALAADGGFVVGHSLGGFGWICSTADGKAKYIENWLAQQYGLIVTNVITSANDIFHADGRLFIAFETAESSALFTTDLPVTPSAPTLEIARLPSGEVELRWPTNQTCTVEATSVLPAMEWTPLTNALPVVSNQQFTLTLPVTNTATFFRLNCP